MQKIWFLSNVVLLLGFKYIKCYDINITTQDAVAVKEELFSTKVELQELLKSQNKLLSELQTRILDLEIEVGEFKRKDRMRKTATTDVGFLARLRNTITTGLNSQQALIFDNVYINVGNGYDARTGLFHVPVAGMYVILVTVSSVGGYLTDDVEVVHNGEVVCRAVQMEWGGCPCNAVLRLQVGDAVWVREIGHRPNDHIRGDYFSTFSMGLMTKGFV